MNYEEYKDMTLEEIDQTKKALQSQYSSMPDEAKKDAEARIAYLEGLSKKLVAKENAPKKEWWEAEEGLAEEIIANNPTSQEIIENAPNTLTKGLQDRGNGGDNKVAMKYDPSYWNAKSTEEVKYEQENNIDKTPPEEKGDNGDFSIGGSLEGAKFVGGETETKKENKAESNKKDDKKDKPNKKYKSSMYGILDAMRNGDIDKSTGIYFMLDALSKAARNTGIDIGNVGAQFTGGTVRNDYQDSLWNQRKNKMFQNEMSSELNKQEGTDKELEYSLAKEDLLGKGLSNEAADLALNASRTFNQKAEDFRANGNEVLGDLYALVASGATKDVGVEELAAIAASGVLGTEEGKAAAKEIKDVLVNLGKTVGNTVGGVNTLLEFLNNPMTFTKGK